MEPRGALPLELLSGPIAVLPPPLTESSLGPPFPDSGSLAWSSTPLQAAIKESMGPGN